MRMIRRVGIPLALLLGVGVVALLPGCSKVDNQWGDAPTGAKRVLASFPPLACFARNVAGPDAAVKSLLTTTGPHDYQGNARDALVLKHADLFLINGLELDNGFAGKLKNNSGNPNLQMVPVGEAVDEERLLHMEEHHHHGHGHGHSHGEHDPHVWLGIPEAIDMVNRVRDELAALDPPHKDGYHQRAAEYVKKLQALHDEGKKLLAGKAGGKPKLVSLHESLGYFARSFGLDVVGSIQPQPGIEPGSKEIARLIAECKKQGVRLIAVEPQYQKDAGAAKVLEELRRAGIDAVHVVVDPLETASPDDDPDSPDWYERKMRQNLANLAEQLR